MKKRTNLILFSSFAFLFFANAHANDLEPSHLMKRLPANIQLPAVTREGSALFTYYNQSGLPDEQINIQIVGFNPQTGNQCFIQYDHKGNPKYFDVLKEETSNRFSYYLTEFPNSKDKKGRIFYLPRLNGARIYTSIKEKLTFPVIKNELGQWTINAPNPLNPNDPNRHILWDKTEYTVDHNAIFINPTAVDNYALSLYCEEVGKDGSKQSGGIQVSRTEVMNQLEEAFQSAGDPWPLLISTAPSMVYSPIFAAATGVIPQDLLVQTGWIEAFKDLYETHPLLIDTEESFPISQGGGIWQGNINQNTNVITFTRIVDEQHPPIATSSITLPTNLSELLAGSGPSWNMEPDNLLQLVFARNLSCAIDTNTLSTTEPLGQIHFRNNSDGFYQYNHYIPEELQFIDHYSKVLHSFGDHQIYTLPYDDELEQSGAASYVPHNYVEGKIILGPL